MTSYTIKIHRFQPTDKRLGRHVAHDSRSLQYRFVAKRAPRRLAA